MRVPCWRRSSPGTWWATCRRCSGWRMPMAGTGPRGPRGMRSRPATSRNSCGRPDTHRCGRASRQGGWPARQDHGGRHVRNNCSLGVDSWVNYGVTMQDGSSLGADSLLMKGEDVPENATYSGNPAREVTTPAAPAVLAALASRGPRHRDAVAAAAGRPKLSKGTHAAHGAHATRAAANAVHGTHRASRDKAGTPGSGS